MLALFILQQKMRGLTLCWDLRELRVRYDKSIVLTKGHDTLENHSPFAKCGTILTDKSRITEKGR